MRSIGIALLGLFLARLSLAADLESPLHPEESAAVRQIVAAEGYEVVPAEMPGYAKSGVLKRLSELGIDVAGLKTWGVRDRQKEGHGLFFVHNSEGRVLAMSGNGPWLRNESLLALKAMPELRSVRIDHNGTLDKATTARYDGSGLDVLGDSKLIDLKLGLSFSDKGMEQAARIKGLRSFTVGHSRVTDVGVAFFEGHPGLESFSIGEMASGRVTEKSLRSIAKMPKVRNVGFLEAFVTYDNGLSLLAPMKGRLTELDLTMSVVADADLAKLKGDHPAVKVTTIPATEIVKRHRYIAQNLARAAPPELAAPLKAALAATEK